MPLSCWYFLFSSGIRLTAYCSPATIEQMPHYHHREFSQLLSTCSGKPNNEGESILVCSMWYVV